MHSILPQIVTENQWQKAQEFLKKLPDDRDKKYDAAWLTFAIITTIPRPSGEEEKISQFVAKIGEKYEELGLIEQVTVDKTNNVIWTIPGNKKDGENIIIQSHLDMVCQTKDHKLDPAKFGVRPQILIDKNKKDSNDPNWWSIISENRQTTLGADNGLMTAFATQLPLLLKNPHGGVRIIFTTAEEQGFIGTQSLDPKVFEGYKYLINIDSEEEHIITIGSGGVSQTSFNLAVEKEPADQGLMFKLIKISGLSGGHSGAEIGDPHRKNAIKLLANILSALPHIKIVHINAYARLTNAIQKEASAVIALAKEHVEELEKNAEQVFAEIKAYEAKTAQIVISDYKAATHTLSKTSSKQVIKILNDLLHGVQEWDPFDKETDPKKRIVQTSTNLAKAVLPEDSHVLNISLRSRSNVTENLKKLMEQLVKIGEEFGAKAKHEDWSPAWEAVRNSKLSKIYQQEYIKLYPNMIYPTEGVTHAGVEPGDFLQIAPNLKGRMISVGPNIYGAHSVNEEASGPSFERVCRVIEETIYGL